MRRALTVAAAVILIARLWLVITRYIDPDEFAHLHWAWLLTHGFMPYRDFFINFVPLYQLFLAPVFLLPAASSTVIVARIWEWILYVSLVALTYRVGRTLTGSPAVGWWSVVILAIFPMTFDKTLELRPDTLMTVLALAAIVLLPRRAFWSGILFGASIATLLKIIVFSPAVAYLLLTQPHRKRIVAPFALGVLVPIGIVLLFIIASGLERLAYANIVVGSRVLKQGEGAFSGWLSFSPWPLVYVTRGGVSLPWIVNSTIWLSSIPGLLILWHRNRHAAVFMALALGGALLTLFLFPTPYLQYFIPLSVFVSILAAMTIQAVGKPLVYALIMLLLLTSFFLQYRERVARGASNSEQLGVIDDVVKISRPDEPFYDMVGSYVFRRSGYYICCNVYSQFADHLGLPIPTLRDSLIATHTKFLVLDRAGKSLWLPKPQDLQFLKTNYLPSAYPKIYTLGKELPVSRGTNTFTILIPETYTITVEPSDEPIVIDDQPIRNGQTITLAAGPHRFAAPDSVQKIRIQLAR